jgi:hypothetical protein
MRDAAGLKSSHARIACFAVMVSAGITHHHQIRA